MCVRVVHVYIGVYPVCKVHVLSGGGRERIRERERERERRERGENRVCSSFIP